MHRAPLLLLFIPGAFILAGILNIYSALKTRREGVALVGVRDKLVMKDGEAAAKVARTRLREGLTMVGVGVILLVILLLIRF
jgi:hypothetical protein